MAIRPRHLRSLHLHLQSVAISGNQWQSVAISGNQWQSVAISGTCEASNSVSNPTAGVATAS